MKICRIFIYSICLIVMQWSIAGAQLPCGLYELYEGEEDEMYKSFNFVENMQVTVAVGASLRLHKTTYSIKNNEIFVKAGLRLKIVDDDTIIGVCLYSEGQIYKRKVKTSKPCKSDSAIAESQNCYGEAVSLRRNRKFPEAIEKYKQCCDSGDPSSCNEYAVMKQLIDGDKETAHFYYKKACDMGLGTACANLAAFAFKGGKKDKGMRFLKEACNKGHTSSCSEIILQQEQ
ncbi:MAG: sel1 repeat family protein [Desulfobacteraceae bacterium]|nr:sel1 repeat family protein [Desulfobacteraceae bacterium]